LQLRVAHDRSIYLHDNGTVVQWYSVFLIYIYYRVWNIFSIIFFDNPAEALSSSSTAALLNDHPTAPRFSSACTKLRAPGMGTVPLPKYNSSIEYTSFYITILDRKKAKTARSQLTNCPIDSYLRWCFIHIFGNSFEKQRTVETMMREGLAT